MNRMTIAETTRAACRDMWVHRYILPPVRSIAARAENDCRVVDAASVPAFQDLPTVLAREIRSTTCALCEHLDQSHDVALRSLSRAADPLSAGS